MTTPYDSRPWLRFYPSGVPTDVDVPDVPLTRLLDDAADRFPRHAALAFLGRSMTYRRLLRQVDRFAAALHRLGVAKGDRVALILPNCPQEVIAFYGTLRLGAVVVMHNPLYTASELHHQLADSGARVAVVLDRIHETVAEALPGTAVERVVVTSLTEYLPRMKRLMLRLPLRRARRIRAELSAPVPEEFGAIPFQEMLAKAEPRPQALLDPWVDLAALQYTGGTTGRPKGAMLTHRNLVANAHQTIAWDPGVRPGREVTIAVVPLFHVFGLTMCLISTVLAGGTVVLVPRFDLDLVLGAVRKWKPTIFPGVPPIYQQLADAPKARKAGVGEIRACVSGAMKLPRQTVDALYRNTGARVIQGYGLTETSPVALANPLDGNARHVSVGVPIPSTYARLVDEEDFRRPVPVGQAGELIVRGPQVFSGYWRQRKETDEVLRDGWVRTGDIAAMSPDGFFTLIDRKRDVVIVDGFNVYPSEVEDVLLGHPAVAEAAVIGVPDTRHGEAVKAYVVVRTDTLSPTVDELFDLCHQRLASHKVPGSIAFRPDLPHNILGKVLRRVLRDEATTRLRFR
ncbi:AMP-binding protein [Actinomadura sp. HBU206391]|uniref:AMP-binding protein n=1 Tax=Actinomadura sp. HBU206391 TaxID=2731692 RepID=UPI00164FFA72|nr:AMP-binding protein [Actinomadura sp. HBU206391]MBC6463486.1 AMP-binding protein [Actinomadura sp. HBU206391]